MRKNDIFEIRRLWCVGLAAFLLSIYFSAFSVALAGSDWPMWRCDAGRSGYTDAELPEQLHLQWVRDLGKPVPAWSVEQYKLRFDRSYEPIVLGGQVITPSMVSDSVSAYDAATGAENWRFYCNGPVRFACVGYKGKVYFGSDDGCLYCLAAQDGKLLWKRRLGPSDRRVLGNSRMISTWPVRGAPVVYDGKVYCAAGIWPFMGIFIYAIDADSGEVLWENSTSGSVWMMQQHNSPAFSGVAPQGYFAATEDRLLIPSRTTPACFDRKSGKMVYYNLSDRAFGKYIGGYDVTAWGKWYFNNEVMYRLADGRGIVRTVTQVAGPDAVVAIDKEGAIVAYRPQEVEAPKKEKAEELIKAKGLWKIHPDVKLEKIHIQAGGRLYGSNSEGTIAAVDVADKDSRGTVLWKDKVEGRVWNMLAGDGRLFVVTEDGLLYCFGGEKVDVVRHERKGRLKVSGQAWRKLQRVLRQSGQSTAGYCLMVGIGDGGLLRAAIERTKMRIVVVDGDAKKVLAMRRELDDAGVYGRRAAIIEADINAASMAPYWADQVIVERGAGVDEGDWLNVLRPYGGAAWFGAWGRQRARVAKALDGCKPAGGQVKSVRGAVVLRRVGALKDSADWVGKYADAGNTACSKDKLEAPLGLLWFGDESQFGDVLPRHGHGPVEQVVGGRLYIEGINSLSARDVYTGRTLWERDFEDLGTFGLYYDKTYVGDYHDTTYNQLHLPGANSRGTNFFATPDSVYIVEGAKCRVLDAKTGKDAMTILLPQFKDGPANEWTYIGVAGDYLIGGGDYAEYMQVFGGNTKKLKSFSQLFDKSASRRIAVMDRHSGKVLWTLEAESGFIHNGIAAGGGRLYLLDAVPPYLSKVMSDRKIIWPGEQRILAVDLKTGKTVWKQERGIFGSWLSYSKQFDVVLQAQRRSRDMLSEPGDRMGLLRGGNGEIVWDRKIDYDGPCILHGDRIITQTHAYDLMTGKPLMRQNPLTLEDTPWEYSRNYGCGSAIASENLLTFRSAAAGFFDLANDGGTGNLGGFKSGCTENLIVADGVLNAPDYTRTCTCSYQNQTSLAMVHMPDVETWTFNDMKKTEGRIKRLGLNFGAPGDCKAADGTLWLDYPSVGGPSPKVSVDISPEKVTWFDRHSSLIEKGPIKWVEASGGKGLRQIKVVLDDDTDKDKSPDAVYTVRLHFAADKADKPYVFDIALQGQTVAQGFDVVKEAGGVNIGVVKEFTGIKVGDELVVSLKPVGDGAETVICGMEAIAQ